MNNNKLTYAVVILIVIAVAFATWWIDRKPKIKLLSPSEKESVLGTLTSKGASGAALSAEQEAALRTLSAPAERIN